MNLDGRSVLITGGATGIGFATAQALLTHGARVVIAGRRAEALATAVAELRSGGAWVDSVAADVTTAEGRARMLDFTLERLGGIEILVNNAGGVRAGRLEATSEAEIRAMVEVDLVAPILLTRAALPALRAAGDGLVVNVASAIALVGLPFYSTYAAVKAGLAHFGEALRRELDGEGVRVLTIFPGATDTPMMQTSQAGADLGFGREPAQTVAEAILAGIQADALQVVRANPNRERMIALNRSDPGAADRQFRELKPRLEAAVRDHSAL